MTNSITTTTPVECHLCRGKGHVSDTRVSAITHQCTTVNRKCRYCRGSGQIVPTPAVVEWDTEIGEIPAWMTGEEINVDATTTTNAQGQTVSEVPGQPGRVITGRPTTPHVLTERTADDIFATIPGAYDDED